MPFSASRSWLTRLELTPGQSFMMRWYIRDAAFIRCRGYSYPPS